MQDEDGEMDSNQGIVQIACGSDFVLCLKQDGNVYGIGQNKSG
jgi:alpha-tubulin suppressor-like RCC1 family protein